MKRRINEKQKGNNTKARTKDKYNFKIKKRERKWREKNVSKNKIKKEEKSPSHNTIALFEFSFYSSTISQLALVRLRRLPTIREVQQV
jgi:hypothetical protein